MPRLLKSLNAWNADTFKAIFITEVMQLSFDELPLQQALQTGSYATKDNLQILPNSLSEKNDCIVINCGIFFSSIIAGCSCSDDPTPVDLNSEYCEMQFRINKVTAETAVIIIS